MRRAPSHRECRATGARQRRWDNRKGCLSAAPRPSAVPSTRRGRPLTARRPATDGIAAGQRRARLGRVSAVGTVAVGTVSAQSCDASLTNLQGCWATLPRVVGGGVGCPLSWWQPDGRLVGLGFPALVRQLGGRAARARQPVVPATTTPPTHNLARRGARTTRARRAAGQLPPNPRPAQRPSPRP